MKRQLCGNTKEEMDTDLPDVYRAKKSRPLLLRWAKDWFEPEKKATTLMLLLHLEVTKIETPIWNLKYSFLYKRFRIPLPYWFLNIPFPEFFENLRFQ